MHTKLKSFLFFAVLNTLLLCAVAQHSSGAKTDPGVKADSLGGLWYLQPVLPSDSSTGKIPEIRLDLSQSRFTGNTGCNRMSGSFIATDSTLKFSDKIITTRMFCAGYNEAAFLQNLLRVTDYQLKNGQLIFLSNGVEIFWWNRTMLKPKKTEKA